MGSFFHSAHCPGAELSLLTLKQELKKLILQNLAKKITTANIKKKSSCGCKEGVCRQHSPGTHQEHLAAAPTAGRRVSTELPGHTLPHTALNSHLRSTKHPSKHHRGIHAALRSHLQSGPPPMLCPPHKFRIPTPRPQTDPERKKPIGISAFENIYFTTVVSDNLAIFILVYIRTYDTQITMLKHKIIPSAVTAGMYRSSVVSSVTIHKVLTATSTYIQFKVWSFSNITKYIYVYIIIASQMHLYFDYGGFFVGFFFFVFFFLQSFFLCFQPWVPPHPTSSPHMSPPQPSCAPCTDHRLPSVLWRPTAPSPTNPTCEHYRLSHRPRCANAPFTSPFTPTRREGQKAAFPFLSRRLSPAVPPIC